MTTAMLIKSLEPGELVIRCADGSLMRTMTVRVEEQRQVDVRKLMRKLAALKQARKR
jgi:hypothetical protein